jgi:hypothetical protein
MRPLLPARSRASKPPVHKSHASGGPGDNILYDDSIIFVGFTIWSLLHAAENFVVASTFFGKFVFPWPIHSVPVSD